MPKPHGGKLINRIIKKELSDLYNKVIDRIGQGGTLLDRINDLEYIRDELKKILDKEDS